VSSSLLVAITRLPGLGELAGVQQGFSGAVERLRLPAAATGRLEQGQRSPMVFARLGVLALAVTDFGAS
jgi:hypothetical protein